MKKFVALGAILFFLNHLCVTKIEKSEFYESPNILLYTPEVNSYICIPLLILLIQQIGKYIERF